MKIFKKQTQVRKRGAALVEYGLLVAGVAMTTGVAVSLLGHKTNDLFAVIAATMPGADEESAGPIRSAQLFKTKKEGDGVGDAAQDSDSGTAP